MDDRADIERMNIDANILSKARFRNGLSVKVKDGNVYRFGVIKDKEVDNNCDLVYVIKCRISNHNEYIKVKERFIMPTSIIAPDTSQDAQKPTYFPF